MWLQRALLAVVPFILAVTYYFSLKTVQEDEELDTLSPEEIKRRVTLLLPKMDLDGDQQINRLELKNWIKNAFSKLAQEEMQERMSEVDFNNDGVVSWSEYLQDAIGPHKKADPGMLLSEEKAMWAVADENGDGKLNCEEFEVFTNPEKHVQMHSYLVKQTLRDKDTNKDGKIDFNEFVGDRGQHGSDDRCQGVQQDKRWLISEEEKFDHELDLNQDGILDESEIHAWVIPKNEVMVTEELDHLIASADDNHNDQESVSFADILNYHELFFSSDAKDYRGNKGEHFHDDL